MSPDFYDVRLQEGQDDGPASVVTPEPVADDRAREVAEEPIEVGWYAYSGGAQNILFHLRPPGHWSAHFDNGTADDCTWAYIEQALGVWDLVLIDPWELVLIDPAAAVAKVLANVQRRLTEYRSHVARQARAHRMLADTDDYLGDAVRIVGECYPEDALAQRAAADPRIEAIRALAVRWRCDCDPGPEGQHRDGCCSYFGDALRGALGDQP